MQWDSYDVRSIDVIKVGEWSTTVDTFPDRAGVYIFADRHEDVKYIGKAGLGRLRLEAQDALNRNKGLGATQYLYLVAISDSGAQSLERELIKKYDPPNNGVDLT